MSNRRLIFILSLAFIAGALVMLMIRGSGTAKKQAPAATADGADRSGHATGGDEHAGHEKARDDDEHAGHAGMSDSEADEHSGHGDSAEGGRGDAAAAPGAHAGHEQEAPGNAGTTAEMWVCEQDPSIGLSYEGDCPLDGKPMVKKTVDLSEVTDVNNEKCPIMGGDVNEDVYAIYQGKKVSFCCAGCDKDFFQNAEQHISDLESKQ